MSSFSKRFREELILQTHPVWVREFEEDCTQEDIDETEKWCSLAEVVELYQLDMKRRKELFGEPEPEPPEPTPAECLEFVLGNPGELKRQIMRSFLGDRVTNLLIGDRPLGKVPQSYMDRWKGEKK